MSKEKPTATVTLTNKARRFIDAQQELTGLSCSRIVNDALDSHREQMVWEAYPENTKVTLSGRNLRLIKRELESVAGTPSDVIAEALLVYENVTRANDGIPVEMLRVHPEDTLYASTYSEQEARIAKERSVPREETHFWIVGHGYSDGGYPSKARAEGALGRWRLRYPEMDLELVESTERHEFLKYAEMTHLADRNLREHSRRPERQTKGDTNAI